MLFKLNIFTGKILLGLLALSLILDALLANTTGNLKYGLYLKAISIILFTSILLIKRIKHFPFKKILIFFLLINIFSSLIFPDLWENLMQTAKVSYWVLGSLVFYLFFRNDLISEKELRKIFVSTALFLGVYTFTTRIDAEDYLGGGSAYLLLWSLPILLWVKQTVLVKIVQLVVIVGIVATVKRGAILSLVVSLVLYGFGFLYVSNNIKKKMSLVLGGLIFSAFIGITVSAQWETFEKRLADKSGSGRDEMYEAVFTHYTNADPGNIIIGFGINSVQNFTNRYYNGLRAQEGGGVSAHSDWLQITHDFGLFGLFILLGINLIFLKLIYFHYKYKTDFLPIVLMVYMILLTSTVYSFILTSPNAIILAIYMALAADLTNRYRYINIQGESNGKPTFSS